jgi:hypothetical protein
MIAGALFNGPRLVQKSNDEGIPLNGFAKIAERLRHLCGLSLSEQLKVAS